MSRKVPIMKESRTLYQGKRLSVVEEILTLSSGKPYVHTTVTHPGAVVILPVDTNGNIYFIKQYRHSIKETLLELPAGTLELNEDPLECAKRELKEEIGKSAKEWISLGILYPAPGFCSEKQFCYIAKDLFDEKLEGDEDEVIEVSPINSKELPKIIKEGKILDGKSLALVCRSNILGLLT